MKNWQQLPSKRGGELFLYWISAQVQHARIVEVRRDALQA